eukprot:m.11370 g.11370  ORF g.11370 m.11370 type:complete len:1033 (-) comp4432_c0_seq1:114-3212(-)
MSLVSTFNTLKGSAAAQLLNLSHPVTTKTLQFKCLRTYSQYQSFINEIMFHTTSNGGKWLANTATAANKGFFASDNGEQGGLVNGGYGWNSVDGNLSSVWDAVSMPSIITYQFDSLMTFDMIKFYSFGDTTHDCAELQLYATNSNNNHINWTAFPKVPSSDISFEARTEFDSFMPMGLTATNSELQAMLANTNNAPYLVFPEDRGYPVRMLDELPYRLVSRGPSSTFSGTAAVGEWYAFQLVVYVPPTKQCVNNISTVFSAGLVGTTCINLEGRDHTGVNFTKTDVSVPAGGVLSLWCGLTVPSDVQSLKGQVIISGSNVPSTTVTITINVNQSQVGDDSNLTTMSRLRWLNSDLGLDDTIPRPYLPVQPNITNSILNGASILNKQMELGPLGFPHNFIIHQQPSKHGTVSGWDISLLQKEVSLVLLDVSEEAIPLQPMTQSKVLETKNTSVMWMTQAKSEDGTVSATVNGTMYFDGYVDYSVSISTSALELSISDAILTFTAGNQSDPRGLRFMGMGHEAQLAPPNSSYPWKWSLTHLNNYMWVGTAFAGIKLHLKEEGDDYASPRQSYTTLPLSWSNGGLGGCNMTVSETGEFTVQAYTGPRILSASDPLTLRFDLTVTPFRTPNETQHWSLRHFQVGYPGSQFTSVNDVYKTGATVINIHQGVASMINPYINYPFEPESVALLANYTADANALGMRVKFYYTVRELSTHVAELFALRMLGDEIFATPPCAGGDDCGGGSFLRQHIGSHYAPAWFTPLSNGEFDAAIEEDGVAGRWLNYYVEGLRHSVSQSPYIDGIYYDGILFDRQTMLRVRRILQRFSKKEDPLVDFHTGNDYSYGDHEIVDAVMYANHWAFVDSLWIGEGFSYDRDPEYWLIEMSGIPFGVFADMLGAGNSYRGMIFAETGRFGCANPTSMWEFWDEFKIQESDMLGWWHPKVPVKVNMDPAVAAAGQILATAYVVPKQRTLIGIASWNPKTVSVNLTIDWDTLGLNPNACKTLRAPAIAGFQQNATYLINEEIPVSPASGMLLVLE